MSTVDDYEFLRIYHDDLLSKRAFNGLVLLNRRIALPPYQARHLRETKPVVIGSEVLFEGYHSIGWHLPSAFSTNQWMLGSGNEIDVLLAPEGTDAAALIQPLHLLLKMHSVSGAWMVHANAPLTADMTTVGTGESICLFKPSTRIIINGLVFNLVFTITTEPEEKAYCQARKSVLQEQQKLSVPPFDVSGIPFESDLRFPSVVFRQGFGSGGFGTVFHGFDPRTGDIRAVKRIQVSPSNGVAAIRREVEALQQLQGCMGIVQLYDVRNNKGSSDIPNSTPSDVYLVQEKGLPFRSTSEPVVTSENRVLVWQSRAVVMYHLLAGLEAIHRRGWMHRDVTRNNLLYFPDGQTARAALCDMGKVHFGLKSDDSRIANRIFFPPEIEPDGNRSYSYKIDIFMLGLALSQQWYPAIAGNLVPRFTDQRQRLVDGLGQVTDSSIARVLAKMLDAWHFSRPNAARCLKDLDLTRCIGPELLASLKSRRPNEGRDSSNEEG